MPKITPQVNMIDLKSLDALDPALELMHFAFRGLILEADAYLGRQSLSRVHHRILYVLARTDRPSVGDLLAILGITKQALHRPLKELVARKLVAVERDPQRHRYKLLKLTPAGQRLEGAATALERKAMKAALDAAPKQLRRGWYVVMDSLARKVRHRGG